MKDIQFTNIQSNLEFVDESSLMLSSTSGETTTGRETVTFTRTSDSATATVDVVLQGVAVNLPKDALYIQAATPAQQFTALANIGDVTWTMNPSVGTLTAGGLYTPPASVGSPTATIVTATSTTNTAVAAQMTVTILPTGTIRLVPGSVPDPVYNGATTPTSYTDSHGEVWYATGDNGGKGYNNGGTWPTNPVDKPLYEYDFITWADPNDLRFDITVPNGSYQVTYKRASTAGVAGDEVVSLEAQGNILYDNLDVFVASGGHNIPWDFVMPVTVTNNRLLFIVRRGRNGSGYAHIGSLQITPDPSVLH
jgi:hypothetical protein